MVRKMIYILTIPLYVCYITTTLKEKFYFTTKGTFSFDKNISIADVFFANNTEETGIIKPNFNFYNFEFGFEMIYEPSEQNILARK